MAKILSMDLRTRVVAAVQAGSSRRAAAARFGVSASCAVKLLGRRGRRPGSGKLERFKAVLIGWVEATPDITMPELAERLERAHAVTAAPSSLSRLLCQAGWTYKKSSRGTGSRTRRCRQAAKALVALDPARTVPASGPVGVP